MSNSANTSAPTELARNTVCFANDLFSLGKEMAQPNRAEFNLVMILKRMHRLTTEEAIRRAAIVHDTYVREFVEISERVYVYDRFTNDMLMKYIAALAHFMTGNIVWSTTETTRYPHIYGQEYASEIA